MKALNQKAACVELRGIAQSLAATREQLKVSRGHWEDVSVRPRFHPLEFVGVVLFLVERVLPQCWRHKIARVTPRVA